MQLALKSGTLAYDYTGHAQGPRPILFLHGALGVRGQLAALQQRFPERAHLAVDFPAHGDSMVAEGALTSARLARDVLALLDALQIEQVDVIGHSMGGYVGMVMAHVAPARVASVVTLGTKFYWNQGVIDKTLGELDAGALKARSGRAYAALAALHTAMGIDATMELTQGLIADFGRWQLSEEMVRQSGVPLLVSAGDRDSMVPIAEVAQLFEALDPKHTALAIIPGAPHPLQHLPLASFEQAVRRFWAFAAAP